MDPDGKSLRYSVGNLPDTLVRGVEGVFSVHFSFSYTKMEIEILDCYCNKTIKNCVPEFPTNLLTII